MGVGRVPASAHRVSVAPEVLVMIRNTLVALALVVVSAGSAAPAPRLERTCGTPAPTPGEIQAARTEMRRAIEEGRARPSGGTIHVAFHVIYSGTEGNVPDAQIQDQIRELNRAYSGTGYRFTLDSVDRTENPSWFKMLPGTGAEKHAKQALAIDPAHHLNLYTAKPGQSLLGWAYFPFSAPEDHYIHGVVVHYGSLPGGYLAPYDLGGTADHEVGHYLGLFHTFENGCIAPGDDVDDTPYEASPAFGCPIGRNTCPEPGDDPIHNYMDYTDDACYTEFTSGQVDRINAILPVYRPSLFNAVVAEASLKPLDAVPALPPVVEFRGATPNPFHESTVLRFSLTRSEPVSLKVYNVAGQLVATLIDGRLPEGDHSALFRGNGLSAGVYFPVLRVGNDKLTRSMVLVK
jgi:hypothetical protein